MADTGDWPIRRDPERHRELDPDTATALADYDTVIQQIDTALAAHEAERRPRPSQQITCRLWSRSAFTPSRPEFQQELMKKAHRRLRFRRAVLGVQRLMPFGFVVFNAATIHRAARRRSRRSGLPWEAKSELRAAS